MIKYLLYTKLLIALVFFSACSEEQIEEPAFILPQSSYEQKESVIQIPIQVDTKEIQETIIKEVPNPLSSGETDKLSADIFATQTVSSKELVENYKNIQKDPFKSFDNTYKYISNDMTEMIDKTFQLGVWIKHKVYLTNLKILFEGSIVKIFTSYKIDIFLDYEQSALPQGETFKIKGLLKGSAEADIELAGRVSIDGNTQLHVEPFQDMTKVKFTKIALPSAVNILELLKVTKTEDFLTKKLLEEPVNKYVFHAIEQEISKKSLDLNLAKRIQKLVQENSTPLELSKDLWLLPKPTKVSITQLSTKDGLCSNILSINIGIIATPELIASTTKPLLEERGSVPIVCQPLEPQIYLYPSFNLKYDFVSQMIQKELRELLEQEYSDAKHRVENVRIYPNDKKLVIAIDLIKKENAKKVVTFYLWGVPKLNQTQMHITLGDFDYTIETKERLLKIAQWLLDERIRHLIQKNAVFSYKDDFIKLSDKLSSIDYNEEGKIINGQIHILGIEDIFLSKDALVVHALASGNLSYTVNLQK